MARDSWKLYLTICKYLSCQTFFDSMTYLSSFGWSLWELTIKLNTLYNYALVLFVCYWLPDSGFEIRNHPGLVGQSCTRRPQLSTVIEEDPDRISQDRKSIFNEKISSDPPVTCKNPKLSELVQMSHESSFWWDSRESNLEIGQDNCDDGITHAIIEHYNEGKQSN